jgi:transposase
MREHGLIRYSEPSIKGSADIDWSDPDARNAFLEGIVGDARSLLSGITEADEDVLKASDLLMKLLLQDIEESEQGGGISIKQGTTGGRIPSATDPEQRHGRKSKSKTFVGSKASIATDIDSQIIVAVDVIPGNAGDASNALALVEQAEMNTQVRVSESIGDCAYGGGETRQEFADSDRKLTAKVPMEKSNGNLFPKSAFAIDLENNTVTCPAGEITSTYELMPYGRKSFRFEKVCARCPLRDHCTTSRRGRFLSVHPQEALLCEAREYQKTPEGKEHLRKRVAVEHGLARLSRLGIGQARYIGLAKTLFQLMMAASVANFRRAWNWEESEMRQTKASEFAAHALCDLQNAFLAGLARIILHILSRFVWAAGGAIPQPVRSLSA